VVWKEVLQSKEPEVMLQVLQVLPGAIQVSHMFPHIPGRDEDVVGGMEGRVAPLVSQIYT